MIGVFDSGIGGLTVVRALMAALPGYDITYLGDTARTPYANKSPETVLAYAMEDTAFLIKEGARLVVMACNTVSSVAPEAVRRQFQVPVFEVITPAAREAVQASRRRRIGVLGTRATVASGCYTQVIQALCPEALVFGQACPLLVPLVEEAWLNKPETAMIIKKYLRPLKARQIDTLILGCTHYPLLRPLLQAKIGKRVAVIDSSRPVAAAVKRFLDQNPETARNLAQKARYRFFVTDATAHATAIARRILKRDTHLIPISI